MVPILGHGSVDFYWDTLGSGTQLFLSDLFKIKTGRLRNCRGIMAVRPDQRTPATLRAKGQSKRLAQAGPSDVELEAARNLQVRAHSRQALPSHLGMSGSPRLTWLSFDGLPGFCLTQLFSRIPDPLLTPGQDSPQWYSKARTDFCHSVGN